MAKYVVLLNWTEQGRRTAKETVTRFEQARDAFQPMGLSFDTIVWTMGRYDIVAVVDAPDDETMALAMAQLGSAGNVSTETLRGFTADEVQGLIQKLR